jgi:hypothetical protein
MAQITDTADPRNPNGDNKHDSNGELYDLFEVLATEKAERRKRDSRPSKHQDTLRLPSQPQPVRPSGSHLTSPPPALSKPCLNIATSPMPKTNSLQRSSSTGSSKASLLRQRPPTSSPQAPPPGRSWSSGCARAVRKLEPSSSLPLSLPLLPNANTHSRYRYIHSHRIPIN